MLSAQGDHDSGQAPVDRGGGGGLLGPEPVDEPAQRAAPGGGDRERLGGGVRRPDAPVVGVAAHGVGRAQRRGVLVARGVQLLEHRLGGRVEDRGRGGCGAAGL
ncbi:hypothetical protein ACFQ9X_56880 [Catenulispora yoronensis]